MKRQPVDPFAVALSFYRGSLTMIGEEPVLLIPSSRKTGSLLVELKAPENSQASRAGFVAQAYQVFPSGLPSRELRYTQIPPFAPVVASSKCSDGVLQHNTCSAIGLGVKIWQEVDSHLRSYLTN